MTLDGERKAGSEVCFYDAASAGNALALHFSYDRVACLPADMVLDFPSGIFHAFARHSGGYVSGFPDYFVYGDDAAPEAGYESLNIPLEPAAWADASNVLPRLKPGEKLGVWIAPTRTHGGVYFPLVDGETSFMVPAGRELIPLIIRSGAPVAVGTPQSFAANERARLRDFGPSQGTDVVAWLKVDAGTASLTQERLPPAEITLAAWGQTFAPLFPLFAGAQATRCFSSRTFRRAWPRSMWAAGCGFMRTWISRWAMDR